MIGQALIRLLNWRHLRRQWQRTLLSLIGVIMGVSTFIFAPTLASTIHESANLTTSDLTGNAALEIRGDTQGFSPDILPQIRQVQGVKVAVPFANGGGLILGQSELLIFFGIDPLVDREVRTYQLAQGDFLTGSGQILVGQAYAVEKNLKVGDSVTLLGSGGLRPVKIVGLLSAENGLGRLNKGDLAVISLDDSMALRGAERIDSIAVLPAEGTDTAQLTSALQPYLPPKLIVDSPSGRNQSNAGFGMVINVMMAVISFMILSIGSMLIYNTTAVSIAQRRAEIGIMRALGTTRGQIRNLFTMEAALLGVIGSLLGIAGGFLMVRLGSNLPVLPEEMLGSGVQSTAPIVVPSWLLPVALLAGTLIPTLAGYMASRAAANIDPVEAMMPSQIESSAAVIRWWRVIAGALIVAGLLLLRIMPVASIQMAVMISNSGVFLAFLVMILLLPPFIVALSRRLPNWMQRTFGMVGMLAAGNVTRRPKRTVAVAMLMTLGVAVGVLISQSNFGYSDFIKEWNQSENIGELTVTGAGHDPLTPALNIPPTVVESITKRPEVNAVVAERDATYQQNGISFAIRAIDITAYRTQNGSFIWDRGDEVAAYTRLQDATHPALLVGTSVTAIANGYTPGNTITFETPNGSTTFDIVGTILGGIATDRAVVIMDRAVYSRLWQDSQINRLTVKLKPGTDVQTVRRQMLRDYVMSGVITLDNADMRAAFSKQITSISTTSSLLSGLFTLIIVAGLGSTLLVAVIDRRREIGMLRAVGMLRRQMSQAIVLEAVVLVAISAVIGVPGAYLMTLMQQMAMQQIMGIRFSLNTSEVLLSLGIITVITILAAWLPARQAGRLNVLEAMRYE